MLCEKCKGRIAPAVVSTGKCKLCGAQTYSGSSPAPKLCKECSEDIGACEICGVSLLHQVTFEDLGVGDVLV